MAEARRGAVRGGRLFSSDAATKHDSGKGSMPLAEAGGVAVCGGRSGAESGEADSPGTLCRTVGRLNTS